VQSFWSQAYPDQTGRQYDVVKTVRFQGSTDSGCGQASTDMGPFYCPNDQMVYLDSTFFDDMLQGQLGAKGGPFAIGYVIAHEYGHHIEDQLGILGKLRTQKGPRSDSVRLELMADCLAGVWAKGAQQTKDAQGQTKLFGEARTRLYALTLNATHDGEHYGNMVVYLRLNGIVPPSSRQQ